MQCSPGIKRLCNNCDSPLASAQCHQPTDNWLATSSQYIHLFNDKKSSGLYSLLSALTFWAMIIPWNLTYLSVYQPLPVHRQLPSLGCALKCFHSLTILAILCIEFTFYIHLLQLCYRQLFSQRLWQCTYVYQKWK